VALVVQDRLRWSLYQQHRVKKHGLASKNRFLKTSNRLLIYILSKAFIGFFVSCVGDIHWE
jgi:hypothetical protein